MIKYYSFHNIVTMSIEGDKKRIDHLCKQCSYFEVEKLNVLPDIIVKCGHFSSIRDDNQICDVINRKYYVAKNCLYAEDIYKTAKWKIQIENLDGTNTVLKFDGNSWTKYILHKSFVEVLVRYKLNMKGYFMVHSSSVAIGSKGIVFPASPEAGKTSTMLNYLNEEGMFMSDDFSIVGDNKVLAYPTPITLHSHNLKRHPFLSDVLNIREKMQIAFRTFVLKATFGMGDISYKVDIWNKVEKNKVANVASYAKAIFLTKYSGDKLVVHNISGDDFRRRLVVVNYFETILFDAYNRAYHYVNPIPKEDEFWNRMMLNSEKIFNEDEYLEIKLPRKYTMDVFREISDKIRSII